jgi:CBS domain containing-hemolysin-like protein
MMTELLVPLGFIVGISLTISFVCSLMESSLLSVPYPYVKYLADNGSRRGRILLGFKDDLGVPIAAILILNTVSNTMGAAVGGAFIAPYGEKALIVFSISYTVLVLILSEIIPKQLGGEYARSVAVLIAIPLKIMTKVLFPLIWVTRIFSSRIQSDTEEPQFSHHEVLSMAELGHEEGVIDVLEDSVIRNVIGLDRVLVRDILTPRVVVFSLPDDTVVSELAGRLFSFPHTRIPLFSKDESDITTAYVTQRDVAKELLEGDKEKKLNEISRPLTTVPDMMRVDKLLLQMVETQTPLCAVVNEHGGFAGLVTLEDILEEIIGREIVDEFDKVQDLRTYAKTLNELRGRTEKF